MFPSNNNNTSIIVQRLFEKATLCLWSHNTLQSMYLIECSRYFHSYYNITVLTYNSFCDRNLKQKDMDTKCKDNELQMECLKTKELKSQIEELKCQLLAAHEKLQRWPFYLAPPASWWPPCAPTAPTSWWGHLTQRLLSVAMIFATRWCSFILH